MKNEVWRNIEGYENYQVSNLGNVKSLNYHRTGKEKILKPTKDKGKYLCTILYQNGKGTKFYYHKLVAQAFIPNIENKPCINHINCIRDDNRVENLEWVTYAENNCHPPTLEKRAKARIGKKLSQETCEKISKALKGKLKGRKQSQEIIDKRAKANSISIVQMDLQNNFIAVHQSATQVERDLGFHRSNITQCCQGKLKTANGYKWCYLKDFPKSIEFS